MVVVDGSVDRKEGELLGVEPMVPMRDHKRKWEKRAREQCKIQNPLVNYLLKKGVHCMDVWGKKKVWVLRN